MHKKSEQKIWKFHYKYIIFVPMKLIKGCLITIIALILLVILFYLLIPIIAVYG